MAEIPSPSAAPCDSSEETISFAGRDSNVRCLRAPSQVAAKVDVLGEISPTPAAAQGAHQELTIGDRLSSQTTVGPVNIDSKDGNVSLESGLEFERDAVDNMAQPTPKQRPWAEPPVVSYTETLNRQVKWKKVFAKLPTITPAQKCRIFDLVGENDALQLYISSIPDTTDLASNDTRGELSSSLFEEVCQDQRAVSEELNEFMDKKGLTAKIQSLKESLPWEEWCGIWCDGNHQRDCPGSEFNRRTRWA